MTDDKDDNFDLLSLAAVTRNVLEFLRAPSSAKSNTTKDEAHSEHSGTSASTMNAGCARQASQSTGE